MISDAVERALRPGCFFVAPPAALRIEQVADESVRWEIFQGTLLDPAHTRQTQRFAAWHLFVDAGEAVAEPLTSLRWQADEGRVYVTRQILCRGFEAYEDEPGVIRSRPVEKWSAELVGTAQVDPDRSAALAAELSRLVYLAIVGTSRLPITSLETPLPAFSLGQIAYLPQLANGPQPWTDPLGFLAAAMAGAESVEYQARALEMALRVPDAPPAASLIDVLAKHLGANDAGADRLTELLRAVFNGVALSPYTHFSDGLVELIVALSATSWFGPARALDVLGTMLRNLCRHLTAFDLTLFHNFGANYPDALFLESLLAAYLQIANEQPELLLETNRAGRLRRRALRQACLVRHNYEGHPVPDAPTSMGENLRVLPEPFVQVPEEQIQQTGQRRRKLFTDESTDAVLGTFGRRALAQSLDDLDDPCELREPGMGSFLDRPLGVLKQPGEVDRTPLVSYQAFSRTMARRRVQQLAAAGWIDSARCDALLVALDKLMIRGVAVAELSPSARPGVVSIADAGKAAADFVLLRTTHRSLDELLSKYELRPLADVSPGTYEWLSARPADALVVQRGSPDGTQSPTLRVHRHDALCLEFALPQRANPADAYRERGGVESVPLQIVRLVDSHGEHDLAGQSIWLEPLER